MKNPVLEISESLAGTDARLSLVPVSPDGTLGLRIAPLRDPESVISAKAGLFKSVLSEESGSRPILDLALSDDAFRQWAEAACKTIKMPECAPTCKPEHKLQYDLYLIECLSGPSGSPPSVGSDSLCAAMGLYLAFTAFLLEEGAEENRLINNFKNIEQFIDKNRNIIFLIAQDPLMKDLFRKVIRGLFLKLNINVLEEWRCIS